MCWIVLAKGLHNEKGSQSIMNEDKMAISFMNLEAIYIWKFESYNNPWQYLAQFITEKEVDNVTLLP